MKDDLRMFIAKIRLRMGRGESWFHYFYRFGIIATGLKVWGLDLRTSVVATCGIVVFWYICGYVDEVKAKIWQAEAEYSTAQLNPYFKKLSVDLKRKKRTERHK